MAQRANREEKETGRFFQDRYRATRLVDEASLLACAVYVDLNPIRAAMCETIESSDHTSVQRRVEEATDDNSQKHGRGAGFLAPLSINEQSEVAWVLAPKNQATSGRSVGFQLIPSAARAAWCQRLVSTARDLV